MITQTTRPRLTMKKMVKATPPSQKPITDDTFSMHKLDMYSRMYYALEPTRAKRERIAKYFSGDQWHEMTEDDYGNMMREDDFIISQGGIPIQQNLIKATIRALEGTFRSDTSTSVVVARTPEKGKASEMLSNALQYSLNTINDAKEIDARALEELLISGLPIQRISVEYDTELDKADIFVTNVHPNVVFFNGDIMDIRGRDIRTIGRLIDYTLDELIVKFGTTPAREKKLREIYHDARNEYMDNLGLDPRRLYTNNFYVPYDQSKCRVIEVWEKRLTKRTYVHDWMNGSKYYTDWTQKDIDMLNAARIESFVKGGYAPEDTLLYEIIRVENVQVWYGSYYSPYGHLLSDEETPFWHRSHPFVLLPYPLLDGQITGLGTDLIDSQRQLNRLFILNDMILRSSVKNTLVVDSNSLNGQSPESIAEKYSKVGSVIALNLKQGQGVPPVELKGSLGNLGIPEMIQLYIKMMQDVSGVHPAMQGQTAPSGTSGTLFAQQAQNSTLNSKDIMDSFAAFRRRRDMKVLKTIQQFYDTKRMLAISGRSYAETAQIYDPTEVRDVQFDLVLGQSNDSPVYRSVIDERLFKFVEMGLIDLEMFLENTTMPFSSSLLDSLRKRKEQAQTDPRAAVQGLAQDAQAAGVQANPNIVNKVYEGMKQAA